MAKTQAAAVAPAPEPTTPPAEDPQEFRPAESPSLDDAARVTAEPTEDPPVRETPNSRGQHDIVAARRRVLERERDENRAQGLPTDPPAIGDDHLNPRPEPEPAPQPQDTRADPGATQPAPAPSPQPTAPAAPPAGEAGRVFKITVAGRQLDMPEADLIKAAELGVASEARLREANRIYEEAQRLRGAPPHPDPSARPSPPAAPAPASQPSPPNRDAMLEIVRAIQFGDENEGADALLRVLSQPQPQQTPPVDPEALAHGVVERVEARLRLRDELLAFAKDYSDIINDADLSTLAGQYAFQLRHHYAQTGTPRTEGELFREAGDRVRAKFQGWTGAAQQSPQPEPPNPAPMPAAVAGTSARTVIKRSTPNAPAAASATSETPAPRQKTGKDIVNDMRKARGQPVYA